MTAAKVLRRLYCEDCDRTWEVEVGAFEGCPNCAYQGEPVCACGCGASLDGMKVTAVYRSEACSKRLSRAPRPDIDPTQKPSGGSKSEWQRVAEESILQCFHAHRSDVEPYAFHSDDLWHVIPDDHRGVISLAVMALVNKKLIVGCGYRKSVIPSRKRSPSQEYRLTELGVERIAGLRAVALPAPGPSPASGASCAESGDSGAGVPTAQAEGGACLSVPVSASTAAPEPEPLTLDVAEDPPKPLSAFTDAEAA